MGNPAGMLASWNDAAVQLIALLPHHIPMGKRMSKGEEQGANWYQMMITEQGANWYQMMITDNTANNSQSIAWQLSGNRACNGCLAMQGVFVCRV